MTLDSALIRWSQRDRQALLRHLQGGLPNGADQSRVVECIRRTLRGPDWAAGLLLTTALAQAAPDMDPETLGRLLDLPTLQPEGVRSETFARHMVMLPFKYTEEHLLRLIGPWPADWMHDHLSALVRHPSAALTVARAVAATRWGPELAGVIVTVRGAEGDQTIADLLWESRSIPVLRRLIPVLPRHLLKTTFLRLARLAPESAVEVLTGPDGPHVRALQLSEANLVELMSSASPDLRAQAILGLAPKPLALTGPTLYTP